MKTKDFIKMLQREDPTGECHVRLGSGTGIPLFIEAKAGYWDGPYFYLDEDKNLVYSTKGTKIDVYELEIFDFVEMNSNLSWDELKEKFIFELDYSDPNSCKKKEDKILEKAKKAYQLFNQSK